MLCNRNNVPVCMLSCFSRVQLFAVPCTVAQQTPLSTGFSRQEYWSGLPRPPPGAPPSPGVEPASLMSPSFTGGFVTPSATWRASLVAQSAKIACNAGLIPESGRFLEEGNGEPFQSCCLGNPIDRVAWQAIQSTGTQRVRHSLATKPLNPLPAKSKNNNNTFNSEIYFQLHKVHFYCK